MASAYLQVGVLLLCSISLVSAVTCGVFDNSVYNENLEAWSIQGGSDARWTFLPAGAAVKNTGVQTVNTELPTYLVTPRLSYTSLKGRIRVQSGTGDDDFIGLVFASGSNAIIMSWKSRNQDVCSSQAKLGTSLTYTTTYGTTNTGYGCDYWLNTNTVTELARGRNFGSTGWVENTFYKFTALFSTTHITIYINDQVEFDYDISSFSFGSSFPMDMIGFYGLSQEDVEYRDVQIFSFSNIVSCQPTTYRSYFDPEGCSVSSFRASVNYGDGSAPVLLSPVQPSSGLPYFDLSYLFPSVGSFTVTLTLQNGGTPTGSVDRIYVLSSAALNAPVSLSPDPLAKCGFSLRCGAGSATLNILSVTGGKGAPYSARWSDQSTSFNPLSVTSRSINSPGSYSLSVSDASCSYTSPALTATRSSFSAINLSLNSQCGSITASATGNAVCEAFQYVWGDIGVSSATRTGLGIGTYSVTARDANQCLSTTTSVAVVDRPPNAVCRSAITKEVGVTGSVTVTTSDINSGSTDPCGMLSLAMDSTAFVSGNCASVGSRSSRLIATGYPQFSSNSCVTTVNVVDTVLPTALCRDFTADFPTGGTYVLSAASIDNGSSDTCGVSLSASPSTFVLPGYYTVTLRATDPSGNFDTCTSTVFLRATEPLSATLSQTVDPAAQCGFSLTCNPGSSATLNLVVSGGYPPYTAQWTDLSTNFNPLAITSRTVSSPGSFTFQVTDNLGNIISPAPAVVTQSSFSSNTVSLNSQCGSITASASGTANCLPFDYLWTDIGLGSQTRTGLAIGTYTVTARDANQCLSTAASVSVVDQPASAVCKSSITVDVGVTGSVSVTAADIDNGSSDPCGMLSLSMSVGSFSSGTCGSVGTYSNTLIASGYPQFSPDSCVSTVNIVDTVKPVARCRDYAVNYPGSGSYTLSVSSIDNGSSDVCGVSLSASQTVFDDFGEYFVTLTAQDPSGNTDTCISRVQLFGLRITSPVQSEHLYMYVPFTINVASYLPNDSTMAVQVIERTTGNVYANLTSKALSSAVEVVFFKTLPGLFDIQAVSEQTGVVALNAPTVSLCVTPYAPCNYV